MALAVVQGVLIYFIVCIFAFEDLICVYGDGNKEMAEQGRQYYQLMKDREGLPKYGQCWKSAIEHINEGCRHLSEDIQSDIALHITNCFLEMSGHPTYNCELDKKPNLRSICINSMTDRAFNVYTEFYTHTQNICWFLRGQIWHETIAENTIKVGQQLKLSAEHQEDFIRVQKESLDLQNKMLKQGKFLEEVLDDVYISIKSHQEILKVLTQSITSLQTWIVGEVSWIDSIIFNASALFLIFVITSTKRTESARFPLFTLLFLNLSIERLICSIFTKNQDELDTQILYNNIYRFVWYSRYAFTFLGACMLIYVVVMYRNIFDQTMELMAKIQHQNKKILRSLENTSFSGNNNNIPKDNIDIINESFSNEKDSDITDFPYMPLSNNFDKESSVDFKESNRNNRSRSRSKSTVYSKRTRNKYELRTSNRQGTPDSGVRVH